MPPLLHRVRLTTPLALALALAGCDPSSTGSDAATDPTDVATDVSSDATALDAATDAATDATALDTAALDTTALDAATDTTAPDATAPDATALDAAATDTAALETTAPDATAPDATATDATATDATATDATALDATALDAATDTTAPDAATDTTAPDAAADAAPDLGPPPCGRDVDCGSGRVCRDGACVTAPPGSCAELLRRDPSRGSGTYEVRPAGAAASQMVFCDMSTGRGYTLFLGLRVSNLAAEILGGCPAGYGAFQVRSEAHADALRRYVRTRSSDGTWYQANFFAGPAGSCPALANRGGWLATAAAWSDAAIPPQALAPLDFSLNCNADGAFDPIAVSDTLGFANRGCTGCQVLYGASEMAQTSTLVCGVNDLPACAPGTEDCDGVASNGCEARVATDASHCGVCGLRCAAGLVCASGRCVAVAGDGIVPPPLAPPLAPPTVMATGLAGPQGLAVARDGRVYVTSHRAGVIHRIDPASTPPSVTAWATGFSDPVGITLDDAGSVVVVERGANRVTRVAVAADGSAGARATVAEGFSGPWGVVLQRGEALVSNQFGASVDRVSPAGVVTRGVITGFPAPLGMRWDGQGRLWVGQYFRTMQSDGAVVHRFDAALRPVGALTPAGPAAFAGPIGIAFDAADNAYVSNWDGGAAGAGRILRVAPDGAATVWYRGLHGPHAIAFDGRGGLWVAEYQREQVVRFPAP